MNASSSPNSPWNRGSLRLGARIVAAGLCATACGKSPQEPATAPPRAHESGAEPNAGADPAAGERVGTAEGAKAGPANEAPPPPPPPEPAPPAVTSTHLRRILDVYEPVRLALAADDHYKARELAIHLGVTLAEAQGPALQHAIDAARAVTQHKTIERSREAFAELTSQLWPLVAASPEIAGAVRGYRCSGAGVSRWLQLAGTTVDSPYQGPSVAECGAEIPLN